MLDGFLNMTSSRRSVGLRPRGGHTRSLRTTTSPPSSTSS